VKQPGQTLPQAGLIRRAMQGENGNGGVAPAEGEGLVHGSPLSKELNVTGSTDGDIGLLAPGFKRVVLD
jgi:hypothetical protein